ncbi:MAG: hypothetical protein JWP10_1974, partial [Nocardioidaceae bacterium]|nr:hypothetical protein [Nocardioidaceae bacterium]
ALVGITGHAALRSPWVLLVLPTLAWRFVSDNTFYWSIDWHYSLPLMPIVFVALIDGVERARADGPSWFFAYARYAPYVGLAVVLAMGSWWPLGQLADSTTYSANPRAASAHEAMGLITKGSSVVTDIGLITHLASDHRVYWVGTIGDVVPDYVLIDAQRGGWSPMAPEAAAYGLKTFGVPYETVFDRDGFTLARRTP